MKQHQQSFGQGGSSAALRVVPTHPPYRLTAAMLLLCLFALTGCGFFPPVTSTTTSGSGGSTSTTVSTAYVANAQTKSLTGYSISSTGQLTSLTTASVALPIVPLAMAITPSNSFLYVSGVGGIYGFSVSTSGALTVLNGGNAIVATNPVSLAVSPDGQWLFDLEADGATLYYYGIASTGLFTGTASFIYGANTGVVIPRMVKVAPTGTFVGLALGTAGDLILSFNTTTGAIAAASSIAPANTTTSDNAVLFDSTAAYLYAARSGTSTGILSVALNSAGVGTLVTGSPFAAGGTPYALQMDSTGKYLYCANRSDGTISAYSLASGVPTALSGSPYSSGSLVTSLALSKSGTYLLSAATGGGPDLSLYTIGTTSPIGGLTSTSTIATGTDPVQAVAVVATQ